MCSIWQWYSTWIPMASTVALLVAYHETSDKKMSLFICCATLSRLLFLLLYRWRSGDTFTPESSKYVKCVCFSFPPKWTYQKEDVCFYPENPGYQWILSFRTWSTKDTMPIQPSLVVYNAALSACAEATEWQHALQQLRDLGQSWLKLKNLGVFLPLL